MSVSRRKFVQRCAFLVLAAPFSACSVRSPSTGTLARYHDLLHGGREAAKRVGRLCTATVPANILAAKTREVKDALATRETALPRVDPAIRRRIANSAIRDDFREGNTMSIASLRLSVTEVVLCSSAYLESVNT